eukprot:12865694-Alexandrium_andersonii.AAC.1
MSASLVGSEMCIRDSVLHVLTVLHHPVADDMEHKVGNIRMRAQDRVEAVSYTHLTLPTICSV